MKFATVFGAALVAQGASAHYFFEKTTYNGQSSNAFQYIRDFTRPTKYNPIKFSSNPAADIRDGSTVDGPDIVCNQGAATKGGSTQVLSVTAGSDLKVTLGVGATMQHPGPSLVYMSRAPGDNVKAYDGSGDWFKIMEEGVCNQGGDFTRDAWCSWDKNFITAKIPKDVPNGEYLVRFEHIGVHRSHVNQPEHYTSCVQVKVTGGGSGTPGPMVKFPGAYTDKDAYANFSIYNGAKAFPMPGPKVWASGTSTGGGSTGSGNSAGNGGNANTGGNSGAAPSTGAGGNAGGNTGSCSALWAQCGGQGFTGSKTCCSGSCKSINPWYSQCHN